MSVALVGLLKQWHLPKPWRRPAANANFKSPMQIGNRAHIAQTSDTTTPRRVTRKALF